MYGQELIDSLEQDIESLLASLADRRKRINEGRTDMDDCFVSETSDNQQLRGDRLKLALLRSGGLAWFSEVATLDGVVVPSKWIETAWGTRRCVTLPDGRVVWTSAQTADGLARHGLKAVLCLRPAWFNLKGGLEGSWTLFASEVNYATGEKAPSDPIQVQECEQPGAAIEQPWKEELPKEVPIEKEISPLLREALAFVSKSAPELR